MSRELPYLDWLEEKAKKEGPKKLPTDRELLLIALENIDEYPNEKDILILYQDTLLKLNQTEENLRTYREIFSNIYTCNQADTQKVYQEATSNFTSLINSLEQQLIDLEQSPILKEVIQREFRKKASKESAELFAQYKEHLANEERKRKEREQEILLHWQQMNASNESTAPTQSEVKPAPAPTDHNNSSKHVNKTKNILSAIPLSILGLLEVYLIYGLAVLIIALIFIAVSYIPILSGLVDWLFRIREDTPDMFAMFIAASLSYVCFIGTAERIVKNKVTRKFTLMLTGIYLIVFDFLFLIINLSNYDSALPNFFLVVAGIAILIKGKNTK